jgi:sirohydrochlorin cobaltochelatase
MAHGSPRPQSNEDLFRVADEVRARGVFAHVVVGFMECNQPDIPAAIDELVQNGATDIVAVPYFLHPGNHVADDLPTILEEAGQKYPAVQFAMGDYLGRDSALETVLKDRAAQAV